MHLSYLKIEKKLLLSIGLWFLFGFFMGPLFLNANTSANETSFENSYTDTETSYIEKSKFLKNKLSEPYSKPNEDVHIIPYAGADVDLLSLYACKRADNIKVYIRFFGEQLEADLVSKCEETLLQLPILKKPWWSFLISPNKNNPQEINANFFDLDEKTALKFIEKLKVEQSKQQVENELLEEQIEDIAEPLQTLPVLAPPLFHKLHFFDSKTQVGELKNLSQYIGKKGRLNADDNNKIDCNRNDYKFRDDALTALTCNIYHESGAEPDLDKIAVGQAVLNRVMFKEIYFNVFGNDRTQLTYYRRSEFLVDSEIFIPYHINTSNEFEHLSEDEKIMLKENRTIADIIWTEGQFSWANGNGKSAYFIGEKDNKTFDIPANRINWKKSFAIALMLLNNHYENSVKYGRMNYISEGQRENLLLPTYPSDSFVKKTRDDNLLKLIEEIKGKDKTSPLYNWKFAFDTGVNCATSFVNYAIADAGGAKYHKKNETLGSFDKHTFVSKKNYEYVEDKYLDFKEDLCLWDADSYSNENFFEFEYNYKIYLKKYEKILNFNNQLPEGNILKCKDLSFFERKAQNILCGFDDELNLPQEDDVF